MFLKATKDQPISFIDANFANKVQLSSMFRALPINVETMFQMYESKFSNQSSKNVLEIGNGCRILILWSYNFFIPLRTRHYVLALVRRFLGNEPNIGEATPQK